MLEKTSIKIAIIAAATAVSFGTKVYADALSDGVAHYNKHEYKLAIQSLDKYIAANPKAPTPLYYEALSYYQLGNLDKAKTLYTTIYKSFPQSDEAKYAAMYLQRVDTKFVAAVGPAPGRVAAAQTSRSSMNAAAAAVTPMGDMTTFEAANATSDDLSRLPDQANVPFSRGSGGHLFVNVLINGRTVKMMFDTGASTCLIGKTQLEQAGVSVNTIKGQSTKMGGVGNKVNSAAPMIVDIRVGGIERHMPVMVQDEYNMPPLLGETFFNGYQYDIDNQSGVIRFTKKSIASRNQGYDTVEVPFKIYGNNMIVDAQVNGHTCPMYFDTGAALILFDLRSFAGMGLSIPAGASMTMVGGVGGSVPAYMFNVDSLRLGGIQKNNVPVCVALSGGPPFPLLGQPFFQDKRYTIDNDKKVIRFQR